MKKFATAMMSFAIMICASFMFAACGGLTIKEFQIDLSQVETTIVKGETFDYSNLKVNVTYSDDTTTVFDLDTTGLTVDASAVNTSVAGTYTVTVTYGKTTGEFDVTVIDSAVIVDRSSIPSSVTIGSTFNWKELLVVSVYNEATNTYDETTDFTVNDSNFNNEVAGTYTITVNVAGGKSASFTVNVVNSTGAQMAFDGDTTVLFNHATYNLPMGEYTLMLADNETAAPQSAYVLTPGTSSGGASVMRFTLVENGDYVLRFTKNDEPAERKFRAIDYLTTFEAGASWNYYKETEENLGEENSTFKNSVEQPYLVGTGSAFHFDLTMVSAKGSNVEVVADENLLNYTFFVFDNDEWVEVTDLNKLVTVDGQDFTFLNGTSKANLGKKYKVVVEPKFQSLSGVEFVFTLNDGVNVFTSEDLTEYFANLNIQNINIHRNIVATLTADQFNPADAYSSVPYLFNASTGRGNVIDSVDIINDSSWLTKSRAECLAAGKYIIYNADGTLAKNYSNSPYVRFSNHKTNDNLVLNGNYFNVDGRDLPLIDPKAIKEANLPNQGDYLQEPDGDDHTYATNSQASIFILELHSNAFDANVAEARADVAANGYENATKATKEAFDALENNETKFYNLSIVSNSQVPSGDLSDIERQEYISRISGSYSGIKARSDIKVDNVNIRYACIGLFGSEIGVDFDVNNTYISDTWANGIYYWLGSELKLKNTYVGASGGTAIWLEDRNQLNGDIFDPYIIFDDTVTIDNFVVGTEPWFVAQKVSGLVPTAKVAINNTVKALSGNTKSIVTTKTNESGLKSELFNFAMVIINKYSLDDKVSAGSNAYHNISQRYVYNNKEILRMTVSDDPRDTKDGFAAVIDDYASTNEFLGEATNQATVAGGALLYAKGDHSDANTQAYNIVTNEVAGYEVAVAVYKAALVRMGFADANTLTSYISQVAYAQMSGLTATSTVQEISTYLGNGAGFAIMYGSFTNPDNRYVEVIQDIPGQGKLLMITEFFDIA